MATLPKHLQAHPVRRRLEAYHYLWITLGIMGLTVLAFTEYPIFLGADPFHARAHLLKELLILIHTPLPASWLPRWAPFSSPRASR